MVHSSITTMISLRKIQQLLNTIRVRQGLNSRRDKATKKIKDARPIRRLSMMILSTNNLSTSKWRLRWEEEWRKKGRGGTEIRDGNSNSSRVILWSSGRVFWRILRGDGPSRAALTGKLLHQWQRLVIADSNSSWRQFVLKDIEMFGRHSMVSLKTVVVFVFLFF